MAEDEQFRRIVAKVLPAPPELAHSVHVDVTGLQPDRWYWYRFMLGDAVSPVGRTRTAPPPAPCRPAQAGRGLLPALGIRQLCGPPPHRGRRARSGGFLGDYIYEWGPYQRQHPAGRTQR
jgi:alkaline phosphatase D